jgi:hypothetical protein
MSVRVMGAGLFESLEAAVVPQSTESCAEVRTVRPARGWNPENFAQEQIRGLVRQVFFSNAAPPLRQVVFSPVDAEPDVRIICRRVGEVLAMETLGNIAVLGDYPHLFESTVQIERGAGNGSKTLLQTATKARDNLWLVPLIRGQDGSFSTASLHSQLCELRREFTYSIVEGAPAGTCNEAAAMAQLADGVILVLSAHRTRRAAALKAMERLAAVQARILGTVLSDRVFPIPAKIYRRL